MKIYFILLLFISMSCNNNSKQKKDISLTSKSYSVRLSKKDDLKSDDFILENIYNCENTNFFSVLEEIPNRNTNAYKLTITSKKGKNKITKFLDTRPEMSKINYCNDLYTVVGFPCGGPCYSQVFVFTDRNRPIEQYGYVQIVKSNPYIIAHIKNEEFEKLNIHNFLNSKELVVDISDSFLNYGQMDSIIINKENLILYYISINKNSIVKNINLKPIL